MRWIKSQRTEGNHIVNDSTLQSYLNEHYGSKEYSAYIRYVNQISRFANLFQLNKVRVIEPIGMCKVSDNVQSGVDALKKMQEFVYTKVHARWQDS